MMLKRRVLSKSCTFTCHKHVSSKTLSFPYIHISTGIIPKIISPSNLASTKVCSKDYLGAKEAIICGGSKDKNIHYTGGASVAVRQN
jgi:hypothetical protein